MRASRSHRSSTRMSGTCRAPSATASTWSGVSSNSSSAISDVMKSPPPDPPPKGGRGRAPDHAIKALVFDFDGLIVDTEVPIFRAWQPIYREHGQELPLDRWLTIIGNSTGSFDPVVELGDRVEEKLDERELDALERLYYAESTALQQLL